jgi:hypothetical protein
MTLVGPVIVGAKGSGAVGGVCAPCDAAIMSGNAGMVDGATGNVTVGGMTDTVMVGGTRGNVTVGGTTGNVTVGGMMDSVMVGGTTGNVTIGVTPAPIGRILLDGATALCNPWFMTDATAVPGENGVGRPPLVADPTGMDATVSTGDVVVGGPRVIDAALLAEAVTEALLALGPATRDAFPCAASGRAPSETPPPNPTAPPRIAMWYSPIVASVTS